MIECANQYEAAHTFGPAQERFKIGAIGDATYHLIATPSDRNIEPLLYSAYCGGHGIKCFVYCATRDVGWWVYEINMLPARFTDYTGSDTAEVTEILVRNNLNALGDKGLCSKDRHFITPYKDTTVRGSVRGVLSTTVRKDIIAAFCEFNNDIGRER